MANPSPPAAVKPGHGKRNQSKPAADTLVSGKPAASKAAAGKPAAGKPAAGKPAVVAARPAQAAAKPATRPTPEPPLGASANGKPRKNPAGLNARELEHFRDLLLEKRREIVGDMSSMEREALRSGGPSNLSTVPMHLADMGTDSYEQEFTLGLVEKERSLLRDINSALAKIQNGTYGICEGTGAPIGKPRLEAQPWARYSIEHARRLERGAMGMRI
jgi:RNA polymerase-binding protein DksA